MSLLLDTNVLSELRKGARCNDRVRQWFDGVDSEGLFLSVLVVGELRRGIERVKSRDARQAAALELWLTRVVASYSDRILPVDGPVADVWGRLAATRHGSVIDALMAATALVHGLVLVTRNVRDVAWTGVPYLDPFDPGQA
jgi:toxin FitB